MTTNARDNLSSDYKYAELPDGKLLRFAKTATDKEIQRAVRRELGLSQNDMVEALEQFTGHVGTISDNVKEQAERHKATLENLSEAMHQNIGRMGGQVGDALSEIGKGNSKLAADLTKAMQSHLSLIGKLGIAVEGLNKTLDAAMGQSLDAMEQATKVSAEISKSLDASVDRLELAAKGLAENVQVLLAIKTIRKRAYPNRDGSWTMEPLDVIKKH